MTLTYELANSEGKDWYQRLTRKNKHPKAYMSPCADTLICLAFL